MDTVATGEAAPVAPQKKVAVAVTPSMFMSPDFAVNVAVVVIV